MIDSVKNPKNLKKIQQSDSDSRDNLTTAFDPLKQDSLVAFVCWSHVAQDAKRHIFFTAPDASLRTPDASFSTPDARSKNIHN